MATSAILPYAGAKRTAAFGRTLQPLIYDENGKTTFTALYVLCCGALGDLFSIEKPLRTEYAMDSYGLVTILARVLSNPDTAVRLYEKLESVIPGDGVRTSSVNFLKAAHAKTLKPTASHTTPTESEEVWAYHYFIVAWLGRSGWAGTKHEWTGSARRWTITGGSRRSRWAGAVREIPDWHERLKNVDIMCGDAILAAENIKDDAKIFISVDPPYKGRTFQYATDFLEKEPDHKDKLRREFGDHARLAAALGRFENARVAVWYYDCPMVDVLYPKKKWRKIPVDITKRMGQSNKRGTVEQTKAPEILLVRNG